MYFEKGKNGVSKLDAIDFRTNRKFNLSVIPKNEDKLYCAIMTEVSTWCIAESTGSFSVLRLPDGWFILVDGGCMEDLRSCLSILHPMENFIVGKLGEVPDIKGGK